MNDVDRQSLETRVLLLALTVKDAELTHAILARDGIACVGCADLAQVCEQLTAGASAVLIAEEAVDGDNGGLAEWIGRQPPWSDMPVLVMARAEADSAGVGRTLERFGNVTVVEQPARVGALVSAVRVALRARQRQYLFRDQLVQRERVAEQLNMAMAAANAGSWHIDLTTGEFSASERALELHGLPPGTHLNHERALACVHPDDRASIEAALRVTLESGKPFRHEHRVPQPDGSVRWLSSHAERKGEGRHAYVVGHVQDVTERKATNERLRESEERFRFAADAVNGLIYEWDILTGCVERQRGLYQVVGYHAAEVPPTAAWWREQIHPDDLGANEQQFVELTGNLLLGEYRIRHRDGRWLHVEDRAVLQRGDDGRVVRVIGCTIDVTERKRVQRALAVRTGLLNGVLEGTTDVIFVKDLDGRLLLANTAFAAAARSTPELIVGKTDEDLFPPDVAAALRQQDEAVIARGTPMQLEETIPVAGEARSFLTLKAPLRDESSRVIGILGIARDITERKQAEEAVLASERRFAAVLEQLPVGVGVMDFDGRVTLTNPLMRRFVPDRIPSLDPDRRSRWRAFKPDGSLLEPGDWPGQRALRGEAVVPGVEFLFTEDDGREVWTSVASTPLRNESGAVGGVVVVIQDIDDRKRTEEALRKSEARLGGILRQSPAGIVQTDAAGCMTMVNPRWCEMLGYSEAELPGRNILEIIHPSFVAPTAAAFGRLAAGAPDFQMEKAYCRKDGSVLSAQSNVAAIRSPAGKFIGMITVVLDISERLRSEAELRRLAAELTEGDRRKDVFLATLAHELRNPLAPIRNGLQIMKVAKNNDEAFEKVLAMMDRQLSQLVRLVDDLLDVSRITQGKLELRKERVDLRAVIDAALEASRPAVEQAGHELAVVVPIAPIFVDGDATRLAQIVSNLLNNSAKYTPRGGHVRLTVERKDGTAVVSVKDDGVGIPPAMIGRVFDMFTQVDRTLEKTTGGLGIGLSLVEGLLDMHGGSIEALSDGEGMGSEFVVRLPIMMDVVAGPERSDGLTSQVTPSALCRILVVDDNVDAADSLGQLLEMMGNEVRTANDGEAGIKVAAQFRPDVVLMDIGMPKLNGYEAARSMRQHSWGQSMVLVALTGWGQEEDRKKSGDAGFDHHLVKPVEMEALTKLMLGLNRAYVLNVGSPGAALSDVDSF